MTQRLILPGSHSVDPKPRGVDMRGLKWTAAVVPALSIVLVDVLRHVILWPHLHTLPGFVATYAAIAAATIGFSWVIFGIFGRLQRQVAEQNRQLAALNGIGRAAAESPRLDHLLGISLSRVLTAMEADAGLICLVNLEQEEHTAVCNQGFSSELAHQLQRAKLESDPIAREVVRSGKSIVLERLFDDPRVAEVARREGIRSAISCPLKSEGDVNGILVVSTHQERRFSTSDQDFLGVIGGQLGLAIKNAALFEQSRIQNRELSALLAVGKAVTSSFDLDEVLCRSLNTILGVTSADSAEVWLLEGDDLVPRLHRGRRPETFLEPTRVRHSEGLSRLTALTGGPVVLHDLPVNARFLRQEVIDAGVQTFCAVPLHYQGRLVGVLAVAALAADALAEPWQLRLLGGIGEWVALAVENSRLRQQIQDAAILHERERIARELHDGLGQVLGSIITRTLALKKLVSDERLDAVQTELATMEEMARDHYADVREAILGLRTAPHEDGGLIPALREYVDRYADATGITAEMEVCRGLESVRLPPHVEIQLLRILQEALSNVRKHARAAVVRIDIARIERWLQTTVEDDGHGFDTQHLGAAGWPRFGLQTMRERAEAIGGTFKVESSPGQGTRVVVGVPLDGSKGEGDA